MEDTTTFPPASPVQPIGDPGLAAARRRWRAAGDRLWPIVLADGEAYQQAAAAVGRLLERLREEIHSLEELVLLEREPGDRMTDVAHPAVSGPDVLAAACALRADEIDAEAAVAGHDQKEGS